MSEITVVILNWNKSSDTIDCLESISRIRFSNYKVVVVDNGSIDDSALIIRQSYPWVTLIESEKNLGFAAGNNLGIRVALGDKPDYLLLLNNDTIVSPDLIDTLVSAIDDDPSIGIAGPTINYFDQPNIIWSAGGAIDWQRGRTRMMGINECDEGQFGLEPRAVEFVTGCAMLVRSKVVDRAGLLDERFFAYYEDTEWCIRAARAGFNVIHVPQTLVWHKISPEARSNSPHVHYYMTRNRLLFLKLAGFGLSAWFYTIVVDYLRTLVSWSIRPKWRGKSVQRNTMLIAIGDYLLNRFGERSVG